MKKRVQRASIIFSVDECTSLSCMKRTIELIKMTNNTALSDVNILFFISGMG
jgi:hypothetical protein